MLDVLGLRSNLGLRRGATLSGHWPISNRARDASRAIKRGSVEYSRGTVTSLINHLLLLFNGELDVLAIPLRC